MNEPDWTNQRIELLLRHMQELRDLMSQVMEVRRTLTEKHRTERSSLPAIGDYQALDRAQLLLQQSEELVVLATKNTGDRTRLMDRQQRELEEYDEQVRLLMNR